MTNTLVISYIIHYNIDIKLSQLLYLIKIVTTIYSGHFTGQLFSLIFLVIISTIVVFMSMFQTGNGTTFTFDGNQNYLFTFKACWTVAVIIIIMNTSIYKFCYLGGIFIQRSKGLWTHLLSPQILFNDYHLAN